MKYDDVMAAKPNLWGINIYTFISNMGTLSTLLYIAIIVALVALSYAIVKNIKNNIAIIRKKNKVQDRQDEIASNIANSYISITSIKNKYRRDKQIREIVREFAYITVSLTIMLYVIPNIKVYDKWLNNHVDPYIKQIETSTSNNITNIKYPDKVTGSIKGENQNLLEYVEFKDGEDNKEYKYNAMVIRDNSISKPYITYKKLDNTLNKTHQKGKLYDVTLVIPENYEI